MTNNKQISCGFCNSNNFKPFYRGEWIVVKCKNCGFIYTNPIPFDLESYYSEEYFKDIRHKDKFYNTDGSIKISEGDYLNGIQAIENFSKKRGTLLEIGAARGGFLRQVRKLGWEVSGVEISADAVKIAQENNLELYRGDYLDYKPDKKYDVICMYQTLEHLPEPKRVLLKTHKELSENGLLVIEVPNIKGWDIKWNRNRKQLILDLPRHVNHFSPKFLKKELKKIGFEILLIDLYYPDFLLKLLKTKLKPDNLVHTGVSNNKIDQTTPMLKINKTWKGKLLDRISFVFPGWRFTIIARKIS